MSKQFESGIDPAPKSWKVTRLDQFCILQRGFDITKKQQASGNVPVVSSGGIGSYHNEAKVQGPGVVIGRKGSLGTVHYIEQNYWPHDTTLWVKDFKGNDARFTYYFLNFLDLKRFDSGAANPTLNRNVVHAEVVAYPCTDEQKKIAYVLSTVQRAIAQQEQLIQTTTELKKALMHKLFTEGLHGEKQKETAIGMVPESWNVDRFDCFCILQRGFDITKKEQTSGDVPVVSSGGIASYHNKAKVNGPGVVIGRKGSLGTVH